MPDEGEQIAKPCGALSTFGTVRRARSANGLHLSEVFLPPGMCLDSHAHDLAQLCVVLEGQYSETSSAGLAPLGPGSVLARPAGEAHANSVGGDEVYALLVDVEPGRARAMHLFSAEAGPHYFRPGAVDVLLSELRAELGRADESSRLAVEGLVMVLAARARRQLELPRAAPPGWLCRAERVIEEGFAEDLRLSAVAAAVRVHPATLAAAFRRHRGTSVGEYLTACRLAAAKRRLLETRSSVAEIASEVGFYDQSHLGRAFRRSFGMSPARYRRTRGLA